MGMEGFLREWNEFRWRNLKDGFPQLNSISWVMRHFPKLAPDVEEATEKLITSSFSKAACSEWLKVYKIACRLLRERYLESRQSLEQTQHTHKSHRANPSPSGNKRMDILQEKLF